MSKKLMREALREVIGLTVFSGIPLFPSVLLRWNVSIEPWQFSAWKRWGTSVQCGDLIEEDKSNGSA